MEATTNLIYCSRCNELPLKIYKTFSFSEHRRISLCPSCQKKYLEAIKLKLKQYEDEHKKKTDDGFFRCENCYDYFKEDKIIIHCDSCFDKLTNLY